MSLILISFVFEKEMANMFDSFYGFFFNQFEMVVVKWLFVKYKYLAKDILIVITLILYIYYICICISVSLTKFKFKL